DVADAYDRGRPRYPEHVVEAIAEAAGGGPRLLDVGAGTGRVSVPLFRAGYDLVAVEPLDGMRAILAAGIGAERALAGRSESLPLGDASVDGAVCSDAWHWFDGARAADELHRVVRPGGGVVVCVLKLADGERPSWATDSEKVLRPLWRSVHHPYRNGSKRHEGLDGHPGFDPLEVRDVPFVHETDREGILAHYQSMSAIASQEPARRAEIMGALDAILVRHGIGSIGIEYKAELSITRRRPGPAQPAGRRAAAS
ncbi:MAG TPA: class I SAM-dependent methyltransferase, partial [Solirubrobacteraceae bacterium]|nr:class I SAM-dependent methyltransferase [Solirubrobacteraceae bacterium]